MKMKDIYQKIYETGIIPVIKIEDAENAVPLAKALIDGGLPAAEITFRTAAAADAIKAIADAYPEMVVGAGTVLTTEQADAAKAAGAQFIVSPGLNPKIVKHCKEIGVPIIPGCANPSDIEAAIELGLDTDKKTCLIMSGSMGYGNIYDLIDRILHENISDLQIIVIAGKNKKLKKGIDTEYNDDLRVKCIGYTDKVNLYMKASDVLITKPGGLSSTEAMVSNIPLILTKPIPGCETENFRLLTKLGCALPGTKPKEAAFAVKSVLTDTSVSEKLIAMQNRYISKDSAKTIAECVLKGNACINEFVS